MRPRSVLCGRYEIREQVGVGNYGVVFEAVDMKDNSRVAVKQLFEEVIKNKELMKITAMEIETLSKINHRYIIKLLNHFPANGLYYLIYEYCEKGDLKMAVDKQGKLNENEALKIIFQMAEALCELKKHSIIHRDIKPENIFLTADICKLGDFGLCHKGERVQLNASVGSLGFLAPETQQMLIYSSKADVYSLGICFYEMIHGDIPFTSDQIDNLYQIKLNLKIERVPGIILSERGMELMRRMVEPIEERRIGCAEIRDYLSPSFPIYRIETNKITPAPKSTTHQIRHVTPDNRSPVIAEPMNQRINSQQASNGIRKVTPQYNGTSRVHNHQPPLNYYNNFSSVPPHQQSSSDVFRDINSPQFPTNNPISYNNPIIYSQQNSNRSNGIQIPHPQTTRSPGENRIVEPVQIINFSPKESISYVKVNQPSVPALLGSSSQKSYQTNSFQNQLYIPLDSKSLQTSLLPTNRLTTHEQSPVPLKGYAEVVNAMGLSKPSYTINYHAYSGSNPSFITHANPQINIIKDGSKFDNKPGNPSPIILQTQMVPVVHSNTINNKQGKNLLSGYLPIEKADSYRNISQYQQRIDGGMNGYERGGSIQVQYSNNGYLIENPQRQNGSIPMNTNTTNEDRYTLSSAVGQYTLHPLNQYNSGTIEVNQNPDFYTESPKSSKKTIPLTTKTDHPSPVKTIEINPDLETIKQPYKRNSLDFTIEEPCRDPNNLTRIPPPINIQNNTINIAVQLPVYSCHDIEDKSRREKSKRDERVSTGSILQRRVNFSAHKPGFEPRALLKRVENKGNDHKPYIAISSRFSLDPQSPNLETDKRPPKYSNSTARDEIINMDRMNNPFVQLQKNEKSSNPGVTTSNFEWSKSPKARFESSNPLITRLEVRQHLGGEHSFIRITNLKQIKPKRPLL